ncbi:MAG: hypothetical protein F4X98_09020 [Gammaproteobacteria bacterium]|nr:hypothetical protein [Gammaproteobacteria bacterium]
MTERVTALEDSRSTARGATTDVGSEVVTQSEFRLFKWLATFALATVLGGFGLLYQQTSDLRVEMRVLHTDLLRELHAQINGVRGEINSVRGEINGVRDEINGVRDEINEVRVEISEVRVEISSLREEMHREIGGLREEMHKGHAEIRKEIASVRERVVRLEAKQGNDRSAG